MTTALLYISVVLIWGSTWLAVKFQVGVVPPEVSVAYRIGIAAIVMFTYAFVRGKPLRFSLRDHIFMMMQGALIFSTNFFLFYLAAIHLTTGLIAVICSMASVMTTLLNALLFRRRPPLHFLLGAILGVVGIALVFQSEVTEFRFSTGTGLGLLLSLGGTLCFSLGSIVSARNRAAGLSLCGNTGWAMLYGVLVLCVAVLLKGEKFSFDLSIPYMGSLAYLSIIGSVIAFAVYFALLARIATEQAAYTTVLFPLVALTLSTFFEGYQWSLTAILGVLLILVGNTIVLQNPRKQGS